MAPPAASGDLNSHPEHSAWRSWRISMRVFAPPICIPSLKFRIYKFRSRHLPVLTFDLMTFKWGDGSLVSLASFVLIFSLLRPCIVHLWSGTGQTDRRTDDGYQCLMPPPYGGGHVKCCSHLYFTTSFSRCQNSFD